MKQNILVKATLVVTALSASSVFAQNANEGWMAPGYQKHIVRRMSKPMGLYASGGAAELSGLSMTVAYHFAEVLRASLSFGGALNDPSAGASIKLMPFPDMAVTPVAGVSVSHQTNSFTDVAPNFSAQAGIDWQTRKGFALNAGWAITYTHTNDYQKSSAPYLGAGFFF